MTSPSIPVNISSPRISRVGLDGTPSGSPALTGTPDLRAIRAQYAGTPPLPNIPPRSSTSVSGSVTPRASEPLIGRSSTPIPVSASPIGGISARRPGVQGSSNGGTPASGGDANTFAVDLDDLPDEEKAKILRRHLVSRNVRSGSGSDGGVSRRSSAGQMRGLRREDTEQFPVPYHALGADVTHDIYKWQADQRRQTRPRAASFAGSTAAAPDPAFEHIHEPGGFRRNYLMLHAGGAQSEEPHMIRNFIDFLYMFGHFAGEDLEEIEEEDEESEGAEENDIEEREVRLDDDTLLGGRDVGPSRPFEVRDVEDGTAPTLRVHSIESAKLVHDENTPLLERSKSRSHSRRRRMSVGPHGDATVGQAILMLLKSFVGTGVLFLGKAFFNGGILFSAITISVIALISLYSFLLLVQTKFAVSGSFGDLGGKLYGPWMRYMILSSITISQIGFVAAYTIFVAENLRAFAAAATHCAALIPTRTLIIAQLVVFLPLALIRSLAKLSTAALVADAFILAGLVYIFGSEFAVIAARGVAKVELFNPKDFPLLIGTAVFSFEGIGLVIPITDSMREPHKFPAVLSGVMIFLLVLFGGAGALSYLAFGSDVQTVVLVNLDSRAPATQAVQFLYSLAILLSVPLQLFPAVRIMENALFGQRRSGKAAPRVKWAKNAFRAAVVLGCTALSWAGAADLDKFVAFVGSFACVPLCYVYPPMLHYKACARTRRQKVADIALMVFGTIAAAYTTIQTVRLMAAPEPAAPPQLGNCESGDGHGFNMLGL